MAPEVKGIGVEPRGEGLGDGEVGVAVEARGVGDEHDGVVGAGVSRQLVDRDGDTVGRGDALHCSGVSSRRAGAGGSTST